MIELKHVSRRFQLGDQWVDGLKAVDLAIRDGEYVAVMGPSGSGKSTLLNVLGLLDRPDSGHYLLNAQDTAHLGESALATLRSRSIGFIFQSFHLVPRLTAFENMELPLTLAGMAPPQRHEIINRLAAQLGLEDRARHQPHQLSGGQRQRVAIGRAMAMSPSLLLADEPTGNLDSQSGQEVIELLEALHREQGITLLIVTHDPELGARASRQIRMADGAIVSDSDGNSDHA
ncbi:ABC transporter ATP-binding protein [Corallincola spongiicola]|uniref:ABC transporter ATP-binding protein n=1 Tax=Corallincola spongiicola TaxID=2520508 RepID=A0ABY1WP30_9GAMM|nr:ABC transporter ATP-binding protein [Corallincola spongiicola]TAA45827.1 ABC transporter ATP-binding protein [Corallincola spongiicola]